MQALRGEATVYWRGQERTETRRIRETHLKGAAKTRMQFKTSRPDSYFGASKASFSSVSLHLGSSTATRLPVLALLDCYLLCISALLLSAYQQLASSDSTRLPHERSSDTPRRHPPLGPTKTRLQGPQPAANQSKSTDEQIESSREEMNTGCRSRLCVPEPAQTILDHGICSSSACSRM